MSSLQIAARQCLVALGLVFAASLSGCSSDVPVPAPRPSTAPAPDELAPDELAEGSSTAFGLPLPLKLRVDRTSPTFVRAVGPVDLELVANYVRQRVDAENIVTGPSKTIFQNVKIKQPRGKPVEVDAGPDNVISLRIEVSSARGTTTLACERTVHQKAKEGLTEDQRWERNGIRKDGKPVDPNKFE